MKKDKDDLKIGKKIRSIKINERQHFLFFVVMLILFNVVLFSSVTTLLTFVQEWYVWVICGAIVCVCFGYTFRAYCNIKNFQKCELHENCIVFSSIWCDITVDMRQIYNAVPIKSFLDKLFNLKTMSLEIYIKSNKRTKFTLHFIEEDVNNLRDEIMALSIKNREINLKNTENNIDNNIKNKINKK